MRKISRWLQSALIADSALSLIYFAWIVLEHRLGFAAIQMPVLVFINGAAGATYALVFALLLEFAWRRYEREVRGASAGAPPSPTLRRLKQLAQIALIVYVTYDTLDVIRGAYLRLSDAYGVIDKLHPNYLQVSLQLAIWFLDIAKPLSLFVVLEALYPSGGFLRKHLTSD